MRFRACVMDGVRKHESCVLSREFELCVCLLGGESKVGRDRVERVRCCDHLSLWHSLFRGTCCVVLSCRF